jgi:rhodanese-related sulfurtransferase
MNLTTAQLLDEIGRATVIDVGRHAGSRQIAGAIRYRPDDLLRAERLLLPVDRERAVVLYGTRGWDRQFEEIAEKFRQNGFSNVRIYGGSLQDFEDAGGRTEDSSYEESVPPSEPDEVNVLDRRY